jgi:hypothetical protein
VSGARLRVDQRPAGGHDRCAVQTREALAEVALQAAFDARLDHRAQRQAVAGSD